jgi:tetratricopeptide (TPR) repeat protein
MQIVGRQIINKEVSMKRIFISYSRQDHEIVSRIKGDLEGAGYEVWIDQENIPGGTKWRERIVRAIDSSIVFILVLSENSIISDNVLKELDLAEETKCQVIPIEIDEVQIPSKMRYQLVGKQRINLWVDFDRGFDQLIDALVEVQDGYKNESKQEISVIQRYFLSTPKWLIRFFVISLILAISGIAFLIWNNQSSVDPMGGHLNILIEPFSEKYFWGYGRSSLGWNVAQNFSEDLKTTSFNDDLNISVLGPSDHDYVLWGWQENDLESAAQRHSERMNAQIVVYGFITKDKYGDSIVNVRFYISPNNFGDAQDLIHPSLLGELQIGSFRITGDTASGTDLLDQNRELRERIEIFAFLIKGLGSYISQDYAAANDFFSKAANQQLWSNRKGLEVIYLITGNLFLRQTQVYLDDLRINEARQNARKAAESFNQAAKVFEENYSDTYSRAYLGLAGVENYYAIAEARASDNLTLIDENALIRQENYLELALNSSKSPTTADIQEKVFYNRAQISLTYYYITYDEKFLDDARAYYYSVIDVYKNGNNRLTEFAAMSYSGLAVLEWIEKSPDDAISNYETAYKITRNPAFKAQILLNIGRICDEYGDYKKALEHYRDAIDRKIDLEKVIQDQVVEEVIQRIKEIENGELQ